MKKLIKLVECGKGSDGEGLRVMVPPRASKIRFFLKNSNDTF